jgi:uncharacterized protein YecT (DUF1311 family)
LISVAAILIYLCVGVGVADAAGTTDVPGYMPSTGCSKGTVCAADQTLLKSLLVPVPEAIGVRCNPDGPQLAMDSCAIEQQISDDKALDSELTKDFDYLYSTESASSGPQPLQAEVRTMRSDFVTAEESWMKYRLDVCESAVQRNNGGTIQPQLLAFCFSQVDANHLSDLRQYYTLATKG